MLDKLKSNLVSGQVPGVGDIVGSYEIKADKWFRIIVLLDSNLNQYVHNWSVFVVKSY